ncbi:lysozyme [Rosenbergiella gaditana]|uniref:lysozyme n=1 Tax=Rosenbergiella gaditana TaxID=2726987 RepID=UPI002024DE02|nr:lysozyme [Rosenbergiella gaditana]
MAISSSLRKALIGVSGAGAIAIATVLVPSQEGTELTPYKDVGGVWTVCSGVTGKDVIPGKVYTKKECDILLQKHLQLFANSVERSVKVPMNEYQEAALISFSYNVGTSAFEHSSVLRNLNAGRYQQACDGLRQWKYVNKRVVAGLVNRREVEREICLWGDK